MYPSDGMTTRRGHLEGLEWNGYLEKLTYRWLVFYLLVKSAGRVITEIARGECDNSDWFCCGFGSRQLGLSVSRTLPVGRSGVAMRELSHCTSASSIILLSRAERPARTNFWEVGRRWG
jgi:hypothetical protein